MPHNSGIRTIGFKRGESIFRPGDVCRHFIAVRRGTVRVALISENGREIVLYRVQPNELCLQSFGCFVQGKRYSAQGVAETDAEIELLSPSELEQRLSGDSIFRHQLLDAVAKRFGEMEHLIEDVASLPIKVRLARILLSMADSDDVVRATHEQLALEIGSVREVVSRQLGEFAQNGWVEVARGRVHLLAPDAVRQLVARQPS